MPDGCQIHIAGRSVGARLGSRKPTVKVYPVQRFGTPRDWSMDLAQKICIRPRMEMLYRLCSGFLVGVERLPTTDTACRAQSGSGYDRGFLSHSGQISYTGQKFTDSRTVY